MKAVTALLHSNMCVRTRARQREIANQIDDLVANEFVRPAKATRVEDTRFVEHALLYDRPAPRRNRCKAVRYNEL